MEIINKRPNAVNIVVLLILIQSLSGIVGGTGLVLEPSGKSLKIPLEWLNNSPFNDYMLPGLILLILLGIYPLLVLYGLWLKRSWAWASTMILGMAIIIWIGVEILIIGYKPVPPLQLIYGIEGLLILVLTLSSPVREYYRVKI
ncbi:MAG TPA: hypothetical protein VKA26_13935 [Ignavibacteriaceae bacterium]|nr:hypothetical protein [Ignavibacteriaceae bacterium]